MVDMDKDPCHELEMARAELTKVRLRLSSRPINSHARKALETAEKGLLAEIRWWQPRCERELRKEEE